MLIGYARVSTADQSLDIQFSALKNAGCKMLYQDQGISNKVNRPGFNMAIKSLKENDTLVVWKIDRLGRTVKGLIDLVNQLHDKNIYFISICDDIDTSTPTGCFFIRMMRSFSQMEHILLAEKTKSSLVAAKEKGRIGGRKRKMTQNKIEAAKQLLATGVLPKDIAHDLGVSIPTLYRWIPAATLST